MIDREGRVIDYLRISVTDRCNLRCIYCMPKEGVEHLPHGEILTFEEMERICRIFAKHGLRNVKITGGEPLVRKGIANLVQALKRIEGIESVTLTTNGILLAECYDVLVDAGVDAITVSLDTLDVKEYQEITRYDMLNRVKEGLEKAIWEKKIRIKINCVPLGRHYEKSILELLTFAESSEVDVRFIEMMPIGYGKQFPFVSEETIRNIIEKNYGKMTLFCERRGNGPCKYYDVPGLIGKVGFISAVSHKFCDQCNRVRLTADGYLKTCLQYDYGVSLKEMLRNGETDETIWKTMEETIRKKPKEHHFLEKREDDDDEKKQMSQIGG